MLDVAGPRGQKVQKFSVLRGGRFWAAKLGLPIVVKTMEAWAETNSRSTGVIGGGERKSA